MTAKTYAASAGSARHPVTLSFRDPDLEAQYTAELAPATRRQIRLATVASMFLWAFAGMIYARFGASTPGQAFAVTGAVVLANVLALVLIARYNRYNQLQAIVVVFTTMATVSGEWLAMSGGRFAQYGAVAVLVIAIFAFIVLQLRFTAAVVAAFLYTILFVVFAVASGLETPVAVVQSFLVVTAMAPAVFGVRVLETSARDRFLQRRQISSLHGQVERLLRRYLSPNVADLVLTDPTTSDLGGEVTEVTVLFADLQGFTPLAHERAPATVAEMLNRYFEVVVPTVIDEGGSVVSFGGDAVVAVFNAPTPCPDHPLAAARAALRIQESIAHLRTEPGMGQAPPFRIGINTGETLVGNIGSAQMRTYTVIGDTVNMASRLQTHAGPGAILVGPATWERLAGLVEGAPVEPVVLKGISHPVQAHHITGLRNQVVEPRGESERI